MLISLDNVGLYYADKEIFSEISANVNKGDHIGLVGINGAGKSTLLNVITGELAPTYGNVYIAGNVSVGYLKQNSGLDNASTVMEEMQSVFARIAEIETRMAELERLMSVLAGEGLTSVTHEYNDLHDEFMAADGYSVPVKIRQVLTGMGFTSFDDRIVSTLSGGEKTRLALAKLLLEAPDVLILDEPTNHLDFRTLIWLEDYLEGYRGAIITVSHDRYFLDKRCNRIWELEDKRMMAYRGNYSAYKIQKDEYIKTALREYEKETARIVSLREYAEKNIARASTSNMAKSRLHQLEHIALPKKPREKMPTPRFRFESASKPVSDVLDVANLDITVGDPSVTLVSGVNLHLMRGRRLAIIGSNGTGKTTFMRRLARAKQDYDDKCVTWGRNTSLSIFEQEHESFIPTNTVQNELWRYRPSATPQEIRDKLGAMLFSGENIYKTVDVLSGGEKARLAFAVLTEEHSNVLLLDEPTNHLDLPAREALEAAVKEFDGTLIFVSHDRYFINALADCVLELRDGAARLFDGNFDNYLDTLRIETEHTDKLENKPIAKADTAYHRSKQQRAEEARIKRRIAELEAKIEKCEEDIKEYNVQLALPEVACDYTKVSHLCALIEETEKRNEEYTNEYLMLGV